MKTYDEKHIKNVVLAGAHGCGKTTLAETMLFEAGMLDRRGRVEDRNTVSDHTELEHERGYSIQSTCLHTDWRNYKINIIDTPGMDELAGETLPAIGVADSCILVLNSRNGVEPGTELVWGPIAEAGRPVVIAVNQLDHPRSDFEGTVAQAQEHFGSAVTVMQYPLEQGEGFHRIIDLLKMTMYVFKDAGRQAGEAAHPGKRKANARMPCTRRWWKRPQRTTRRLMEHYFEKGELDEDEMRRA
jgi:elongation factor G